MNILLTVIWLIGFLTALPTLIKAAGSKYAPTHEDTLDYALSALVVVILAAVWPATFVLGIIAYFIKKYEC